jgi:hypothetical protein
MLRHCSLLACLLVCAAASAIAPGDLPSAGPVHSGGDAEFLALVPTLEAQFSNVSPSDEAGAGFFNPQFHMSSDTTMRVYVLSHDSAYPDAFGYTRVAGDISTGVTIFADTSGLAQGDYVDVTGVDIFNGSFIAMTNHAVGGGDLFWGEYWMNGDGLSHIQAAGPVTGAWWVLALDDQLGGGDRDWNDLRLAVHFFVATPEPTTWALIAGFAGIAAWLWRRQRPALS